VTVQYSFHNTAEFSLDVIRYRFQVRNSLLSRPTETESADFGLGTRPSSKSSF
jgi:hypothetical protein